MKCANCSKDAFYVYQLAEKTQMFYCNKHLPSFLEKAKKAGLLKTTDELRAVLQEGFKPVATPAVETPVEEPVVEEPTVEEPVVEEPVVEKPKKKAAKKKAE